MKPLQGEKDVLKCFTAELAKASEFYLAMALVTSSGLRPILGAVERVLERRGRGYVLFGIDLPTDPEAIESLRALEIEHKGTFQIRRFQSGGRFFHSKLSVFVRRTGARTAIIGSSNLTGGGLGDNHETNILLTDHRMVQKFLDYFEEHFQGAHARRVDQRWLDQYWQLWTQRKRAEKHQRRLREKTRKLGAPPANIPAGIEGHVFAFTGAIAGWPRKSRLYPYVKRHGGRAVEKAGAMGSVECLVHAEILGGRKSTQKLLKARRQSIPIITEEQFFKLARIKQ